MKELLKDIKDGLLHIAVVAVPLLLIAVIGGYLHSAVGVAIATPILCAALPLGLAKLEDKTVNPAVVIAWGLMGLIVGLGWALTM